MIYDIIHMADDEYGNDLMRQIAEEHFAKNPTCQCVEVREHGGWYLCYRRDVSCCGTANDMARSDPGLMPTEFSGVEIRRKSALPAYKVSLEDGSNYVTSMAADVTLKDARDYFLGKRLTQDDEVTRLLVVDVQPA